MLVVIMGTGMGFQMRDGFSWWLLLAGLTAAVSLGAFVDGCTRGKLTRWSDQQAAQRRREAAEIIPVSFQLGCLTGISDRQSNKKPGQGVALEILDAVLPTPEYTSWKEHYQVRTVSIRTPRQGSQETELECPVCGQSIVLRVESTGFLVQGYRGVIVRDVKYVVEGSRLCVDGSNRRGHKLLSQPKAS
jgi:hypothetical protein